MLQTQARIHWIYLETW